MWCFIPFRSNSRHHYTPTPLISGTCSCTTVGEALVWPWQPVSCFHECSTGCFHPSWRASSPTASSIMETMGCYFLGLLMPISCRRGCVIAGSHCLLPSEYFMYHPRKPHTGFLGWGQRRGGGVTLAWGDQLFNTGGWGSSYQAYSRETMAW